MLSDLPAQFSEYMAIKEIVPNPRNSRVKQARVQDKQQSEIQEFLETKQQRQRMVIEEEPLINLS